MATKLCPFCAEEIQQEAVKCKHCGSWLSPPTDPSGYTPPPGPAASYPEMGPVTAPPLTRPLANRMIAGVCAGLGRYLGMDMTLVRILYALVTFFTGIVPGVIVYVILAFVIPSEDHVQY